MKHKSIIIMVLVVILTSGLVWFITEGKIYGGGFTSISPGERYRLDVIGFRRLFKNNLVCVKITDIPSGKAIFQYGYLSNEHPLLLRGQKDKKIIWMINKGIVNLYFHETIDDHHFNTCLIVNFKTQEMRFERFMQSVE